jgi:hypothetical protein
MDQWRCWEEDGRSGHAIITWRCPVCTTWTENCNSGLALINHLHNHTTRELKDKWLEKTLS